MFKENLLESSEKIEIEILKKLYINNGIFSKYKLCDELHISFPTLKLYIRNINMMFFIRKWPGNAGCSFGGRHQIF